MPPRTGEPGIALADGPKPSAFLVQSIYELKINPVFWAEEPAELEPATPASLPAPTVQPDPADAWAWV